jgi:predicted RNA binding protein YcfA (HicA-like mRNA interferase family)
MKFPNDAPLRKVLKTFEKLGFKTVRSGNHIAMVRNNPDGSHTPLTLPGHDKIKGSTLRIICRQSGISRKEFLEIYDKI